MSFPENPTIGQIYNFREWDGESWVEPENPIFDFIKTNGPRFYGVGNSWDSSKTGNFTVSTIYEDSGHFNNSAGVFSVPIKGSYFLFFDALINASVSPEAYSEGKFLKNGNEINGRFHTMHDITRPYEPLAYTGIMYADVGDEITMYFATVNGAYIHSTSYSKFGIIFLN